MSLNLNSSGRVIDVGSRPILNDRYTFTAIAWVYAPTSFSGYVLSKTPSSYTQWFDIYFNNTNKRLQFEIKRNTVNLVLATASGTIATGRWQFAATTFNGDTDGRLYVGTLTVPAYEPSYATYTIGSGTIPTDASYNMYVGRGPNVSQFLSGYMSLFGFWGRQMGLAEIQNQQFDPHVSPGCLVFYKTGMQNNAKAWDESEYGNHGTITAPLIWPNVPVLEKPRKKSPLYYYVDYLSSTGAFTPAGTSLKKTTKVVGAV